MSDSRGVSEKAIQKNCMKLTPPAYVSNANISLSYVSHKGGKYRNSPCGCGIGLKRKHCKCGVKAINESQSSK